MDKAITDRWAFPVEEAAFKAGVSRATFYKEIRRGAVKVIKIGASTRVLADDLRAYLESLRAN
jgi:excisionase family DNA binding protein